MFNNLPVSIMKRIMWGVDSGDSFIILRRFENFVWRINCVLWWFVNLWGILIHSTFMIGSIGVPIITITLIISINNIGLHSLIPYLFLSIGVFFSFFEICNLPYIIRNAKKENYSHSISLGFAMHSISTIICGILIFGIDNLIVSGWKNRTYQSGKCRCTIIWPSCRMLRGLWEYPKTTTYIEHQWVWWSSGLWDKQQQKSQCTRSSCTTCQSIHPTVIPGKHYKPIRNEMKCDLLPAIQLYFNLLHYHFAMKFLSVTWTMHAI